MNHKLQTVQQQQAVRSDFRILNLVWKFRFPFNFDFKAFDASRKGKQPPTAASAGFLTCLELFCGTSNPCACLQSKSEERGWKRGWRELESQAR